VIGAFVARGLTPPLAAALAAHVHGRAASLAPGRGMVAPDLPDLVLAWLAAAGAA
jgi:NAD(P)H-hydrate repair Nnr-like enzyme with NAD(P)H-hydrate dehydratase domain